MNIGDFFLLPSEMDLSFLPLVVLALVSFYVVYKATTLSDHLEDATSIDKVKDMATLTVFLVCMPFLLALAVKELLRGRKKK